MAPGSEACVCDSCREAHAALLESHEPGSVAQVGEEAFQQRSLARLIEDACAGAQELGLRAVVGVLPGPAGQGSGALVAQLTAARAADVVAVSPLWRAHGQPVSPYVRDACAAVVAACRDSQQEPMAWLQAFSIPARREYEITQAAEAMAAAGIGNISTWCYRAGEQMTAVRSEQAQLAWETVVTTYRRLKASSAGG